MGLKPGTPMTDIDLDKVFIGSCTNARIEDLRAAAAVARGRKVAANIKLAMVVPGSGLVKAQAEAEGLDEMFMEAGFEWREPGCSMCLAMNADRLAPGERCASTSNRNFEGRQGAGRTHPSGQSGDGGGRRDRRTFCGCDANCDGRWTTEAAMPAFVLMLGLLVAHCAMTRLQHACSGFGKDHCRAGRRHAIEQRRRSDRPMDKFTVTERVWWRRWTAPTWIPTRSFPSSF